MTHALLENAIDVHVHTAPDLISRYGSDLKTAHEALDSGMAGVVVKSHVVPTVGRVDLINEAVGETILYGGVTLNGSVGGINPAAVEVALKLGAAIIWLPTAWSANHAQQARAAGLDTFVGQRLPGPDDELHVVANGSLTNDVRHIIELVDEYDAVLGTGHIAPAAAKSVVSACAEVGARCLVNHPFFRIVDMPLSDQVELAEQGAVMEYCAYSLQSTKDHTIKRVVEAVERIGPENCLLATDFGQAENPPAPGLAAFGESLIDAGLDRETVSELVTETPATILGH